MTTPTAQPALDLPPGSAPTETPEAKGTDLAPADPVVQAASTAISKQDEKETAIGNLPAEVKQMLLIQKQRALVQSEIGRLNWGKGIDELTRRAVAAWGEQHGIDVLTEVDVMGNSFYINAKFYLRKLGHLHQAGVVEYAYGDNVHADPRLDVLATEPFPPEPTAGAHPLELEEWRKRCEEVASTREWAYLEVRRRQQERATHGIPEEATGACVFHVKHRNLTRDIIGVNWCGGETKEKSSRGGIVKGMDADPIGELEPIKTAETRALRRAVRQLVGHLPEHKQAHELMLTERDTLNEVLARDVQEFREAQRRLSAVTPLKRADGYGG